MHKFVSETSYVLLGVRTTFLIQIRYMNTVHIVPRYLITNSILLSHIHLGLPMDLFLSTFSDQNIRRNSLLSHACYIPSDLTLTDFAILIISYQAYKQWSPHFDIFFAKQNMNMHATSHCYVTRGHDTVSSESHLRPRYHARSVLHSAISNFIHSLREPQTSSNTRRQNDAWNTSIILTSSQLNDFCSWYILYNYNCRR